MSAAGGAGGRIGRGGTGAVEDAQVVKLEGGAVPWRADWRGCGERLLLAEHNGRRATAEGRQGRTTTTAVRAMLPAAWRCDGEQESESQAQEREGEQGT